MERINEAALLMGLLDSFQPKFSSDARLDMIIKGMLQVSASHFMARGLRHITMFMQVKKTIEHQIELNIPITEADTSRLEEFGGDPMQVITTTFEQIPVNEMDFIRVQEARVKALWLDGKLTRENAPSNVLLDLGARGNMFVLWGKHEENLQIAALLDTLDA